MSPHSKEKQVFLCSECGAEFPRWMGKCPSCGAWNSLEKFTVPKGKRAFKYRTESFEVTSLTEPSTDMERISTGIGEWDRVAGGGIVPGSALLIGGEPGIGKSTLVLQISDALARKRAEKVLYISGEESPHQIQLRAQRLKIKTGEILLSNENCVERIIQSLNEPLPQIIIIDSIQTIYTEEIDSFPGSMSQIREGAGRLIEFAKRNEIPLILIGHITKEGAIAGPKLLEHIVDVVLYMEGDRQHNLRLLRAVKNRFGNTNELGVFEMGYTGLIPVKNPAGLFITGRKKNVPGSVIVASMEGSRPFLIEIQALVSTATYGTPQRSVTGINIRRLSMLLAVLEKRLNMYIGSQDVFVNLVGGLRIEEPAIDLGIITAVASSFKNQAVAEDLALIGEVGLAGELRAVNHIQQRLQTLSNLGYKKAIIPHDNLSRLTPPKGVKIMGMNSVEETFEYIF